MSKDKKKKKKDKKDGHGNGATAKASKGFQTLTQNPMVADVVAAALVATASALKDTNKARRLAEYAGDELEALSKKSAERGNAMWKLALDIGRHALDTFANEPTPLGKIVSTKSPSAKPSAPKRSAAKKSTAKKSTSVQKPAAANKVAAKKSASVQKPAAAKRIAAKKSAASKGSAKKSARTIRKAK